MEWWRAPTTGGGYAEVVRTAAEGGGGGGGMTCESPGPEPEMWFSGGGGTEQYVVWGGRVNVEADVVRLELRGAEPVTLDIQPGGYYLAVLPVDAGPGDFPDVMAVRDGEIVATAVFH